MSLKEHKCSAKCMILHILGNNVTMMMGQEALASVA
jgi:hypothetical protein